jgi:hypothetical protein
LEARTKLPYTSTTQISSDLEQLEIDCVAYLKAFRFHIQNTEHETENENVIQILKLIRTNLSKIGLKRHYAGLRVFLYEY